MTKEYWNYIRQYLCARYNSCRTSRKYGAPWGSVSRVAVMLYLGVDLDLEMSLNFKQITSSTITILTTTIPSPPQGLVSMPSLSFRPTSSHPWSFQKPVESSIEGHGSEITFKTLARTDWWCDAGGGKTSGAIYGLPIPDLFDCEHKFSVGLGVDYQGQVSCWEVLLRVQVGLVE